MKPNEGMVEAFETVRSKSREDPDEVARSVEAEMRRRQENEATLKETLAKVWEIAEEVKLAPTGLGNSESDWMFTEAVDGRADILCDLKLRAHTAFAYPHFDNVFVNLPS